MKNEKTKLNTNFFNLKQWINKEKKENQLLFKNLPVILVTLFVASIICMNLLANKTLVQNYYIALDGGILISWLSFMCMDIVTKYFGPKASNKLTVIACIINLFICIIFYIASIIPSNSNDYTILNNIFGGTWFIWLGSTIAFVLSSFINNFLNYLIGKSFRKNAEGKVAFVTRTYISTFIAQFVDNLVFSIFVFMCFAPIFWDGFYWTFIQCLTCAVTGAVAELFMEMIFSPIAYKVIKKWKEDNLGQDYINYIKGDK